jgi:uncharacterized glyoxalase superfamily protein PhnB
VSIPPPTGSTTVAPWLVSDDTDALLEFVARAFDGEELGRVQLEDGSIGHAEIRVGDTVLLAFDRRPGWPQIPSLLRVVVEDADATVARARAAGARVVTEPSDHAFGQRIGRVRDPFGHIWWISADVADASLEHGMQPSPDEYEAAMCDAQETLDDELREGSLRLSAAAA